MINRKIVFMLIFVFCILICNKSAFAANYTDEVDEIDPNASASSTIDYGDYSYMIVEKSKGNYVAYIVDYRGDATELDVPSTIAGYPVYGLYTECFANGKNLKKINIPSCVGVIYPDTLLNCRNLEEVNIDKNNGTYSSDDGMIYSKDYVFFVSCPESKKGEVTLRDETEYICDYSFFNASKITTLNIPKKVFDIGVLALYNTSSLERVNIENGNKFFVFSDGLLYNQDKTELIKCVDTRRNCVNIASSVKSIREYAFYGCKELLGPLNLPDGLVSIGEGAFCECNSLSGKIDFPSTLDSIGNKAFYNCYSITNVDFDSEIEEIPDDCFGNCTGLEEINISNNIREIGERAFFNCNSVKSLYLGNSLRTIGGWAFDYLTSLDGDLIIPDSVTKIGDAAFFNCESLDGYIVIGSNVHEIGDSVFYRADNAQAIIFKGSVPSITYASFIKPDVPYYYLEGRVGFENLIEGKEMLTYVDHPKVTFLLEDNKYKEISLNNYGTSVEEFAAPQKENYNFDGWYYDQDYTKKYSFSDKIMNNVTLYAKLETINSIEFLQDEVEIEEGNSLKLDYKYNLEDGASIEWKSSDTSIVEVDATGIITAKSEGQAIVTASYNDIVAQITVNVLKEKNRINFIEDVLNIVIGNMQDIDLNYHLLNNATFEDINWNSSDTNIATVENGKITAISEGNVTITATYEDAEDTIEINVLKPNKLDFVSDIIDVEYRNNSIIEFDIDYYFNDDATEEDIIFESDNPDVVKINNNEFEIVGVGKATITAKYKDVSDTVVVNIYSIDKLEFNKRGYIVKAGDVVKLDYLFDSFDKNEEDIIFTSSDDEVASIVDGNIVAKSQGKVLVTAKYNDIVAQINVIVSDNNYILGDANFDGIVNSDDAAVALDMYRYGNSTSVQKMVADLNFDNIINADDAALILDIYRYGE